MHNLKDGVFLKKTSLNHIEFFLCTVVLHRFPMVSEALDIVISMKSCR